MVRLLTSYNMQRQAEKSLTDKTALVHCSPFDSNSRSNAGVRPHLPRRSASLYPEDKLLSLTLDISREVYDLDNLEGRSLFSERIFRTVASDNLSGDALLCGQQRRIERTIVRLRICLLAPALCTKVTKSISNPIRGWNKSSLGPCLRAVVLGNCYSWTRQSLACNKED